MKKLTHLNDKNQPGMVDVSPKNDTTRTATAHSIIELGEELMNLITDGDIQSKKGPIFQTAIIAGTMAAKKTSELIPFCHPLPLHRCQLDITPTSATQITITCTCLTTGKTGVEMEALTGASIAALTLYDMGKALNKSIIIQETKLLEKTGGKSGHFQAHT